jgi:hypothetical protein
MILWIYRILFLSHSVRAGLCIFLGHNVQPVPWQGKGSFFTAFKKFMKVGQLDEKFCQ